MKVSINKVMLEDSAVIFEVKIFDRFGNTGIFMPTHSFFVDKVVYCNAQKELLLDDYILEDGHAEKLHIIDNTKKEA